MGLWLQIQNYYHANRITHQDRLRELFYCFTECFKISVSGEREDVQLENTGTVRDNLLDHKGSRGNECLWDQRDNL